MTQSGVFRSYYMLANPEDQMRAYITDALRSAIPNYSLDEVFDNKDSIAADVNSTVAARMVGYGYDLVSTLITSIYQGMALVAYSPFHPMSRLQ